MYALGTFLRLPDPEDGRATLLRSVGDNQWIGRNVAEQLPYTVATDSYSWNLQQQTKKRLDSGGQSPA
jgi:hypothetical protein